MHDDAKKSRPEDDLGLLKQTLSLTLLPISLWKFYMIYRTIELFVL